MRSRDRTRLRRNASFPFLKKSNISWRDFAPDFALKTRTTKPLRDSGRQRQSGLALWALTLLVRQSQLACFG
jgi:hypothetical protein